MVLALMLNPSKNLNKKGTKMTLFSVSVPVHRVDVETNLKEREAQLEEECLTALARNHTYIIDPNECVFKVFSTDDGIILFEVTEDDSTDMPEPEEISESDAKVTKRLSKVVKGIAKRLEKEPTNELLTALNAALITQDAWLKAL